MSATAVRRPAIAAPDDTGMFAWWHAADQRARRAFIAASLGWMLDSFDVMLYSLVLASLIQDPVLQLSTSMAGQLGALTLLAAAVGGVVFGVLADRFGRKRALMAAVLIYSVFTAACGLVQNVGQLAVFRILLGFGMGGEWATGVALVSETFPARHRGKALAFVQSSWAIGYGLAAPGEPDRHAALGLARRVLRGRDSGALHAVGAPQRRGAGAVAAHGARGAGPHQRALHRRARPHHRLPHPHERLHACSAGGA